MVAMQPKPRILEYSKLSTTVTLHCVRQASQPVAALEAWALT